MHSQSVGQELQSSPFAQAPSPQPTHWPSAMMHCVPGGHGQSWAQVSQSSLPAQTPSPQFRLPQSVGHVVPFSPIEQHPSPQLDVVQSGSQRQGFSVGPQQLSPQVSVQSPPNIVWQLHPVSPGSQVPSPQPLQGGPQDCPGAHAQSTQLAQFSVGSHVVLPQIGGQSMVQLMEFSKPEQQPSPQCAVVQSAGQLHGSSPSAQSPSPHPEHM